MLLLLLIGVPLTGRAQEITALHTFFQQNFDSTIIYQRSFGGFDAPSYLILTKYQDRLEFFSYTSPYRTALGHYYPGKLGQKFRQEEARFRATPPDTNRYLLPKLLAADVLWQSWKQLNPPQLWAIKDDQEVPTRNCIVDDGDHNTFYLISKKSIRVAQFYAPAAYQKCAGKDINRERAIQASYLLRTLYEYVP